LVEQELEYLAAKGFISFDHINEKGQKIYVLTEKGQIALLTKDEPSTTDERSDLIKQEEEKAQKIDIFTEMGRIARMTREEHVALMPMPLAQVGTT
jgi:DNA-binding PadR family transcriptional regulator